MSTNRWLLLLPAIVLAGAVFLARTSGNDKAPFIVLAVLALLALGLAGALLVFLFSGLSHPHAGWLAAGLLVPLVYAALVLLLTRAGLADPLPWLGFR